MRWPAAIFCGLTLVALGSGCRSNSALVESELRSRDNDLRELRDELDRSEGYNRALQHEIHSIRGDGPGSGPLPPGQGPLPPGQGPFPPGPGELEKPVAVYPLRGVTLGRQTGGHDTPGCPGDSALQVVLEPHDLDNHTIKVAASALIQVLEITPEGLKHPLSTWEIPPDQLRASWRQGLLSTGYTLILPWKVWPSQTKLRVVAQLRVADGRLYEADKDVTIKLVSADKRPSKPADDMAPGKPEEPFLPKMAPSKPEEPFLPKPPTPEHLPLPPSPGPGPVLPPPSADEKPANTIPAWGDPTPQPLQTLSGAVKIHRPIAVPTAW